MTPGHQRIDMKSNENIRCVVLATFGQSAKFISEQTGLSIGQIGYRIYKLTGIKLRDWRNGNSPIFKRVYTKFWRQITSY